jgi:hypothetical protein
MALNTTLSADIQDAATNAAVALADNGYIRYYTAPQPANPDAAITTQAQVAELRFGATAFGASSAGVAAANAITKDSSADGGAAAWFRVFASNGSTPLWDGSIGTSGCNINLSDVNIPVGAEVTLSSYTFTCPVQGA